MFMSELIRKRETPKKYERSTSTLSRIIFWFYKIIIDSQLT